MTRPPAQLHSPTSVAAADAIAIKAGNLRENVLAAIRVFGPCTDLDLERLTGLGGSTVRPRRVELQRLGLIEPAGTGVTPSGRKAVRWAAVPVQQTLGLT